MNGSDLMKFDSPPFKNGFISEKDSINSPGSNPFDILSNRAETLSFTNTSNDRVISGNDSDLKFTTDLLNFDKETLLFDLSGRESLGILNLESLNCNLIKDELNISNSDQLNTAFLHPYSMCNNRRLSYLLSNSSISVTPSFFHSGSLEASELWKSSVSSILKNDNNNLSVSVEGLNNGFILNSRGSDHSMTLHQHQQRILSLLNSNNSKKTNIFNFDFESEQCDKQIQSDTINSCALDCLTEENKEDNEFNDSVFFEARHLAAQLKDGTPVEDSFLDNTNPPEFIDINEDEDTEQNPVDLKDEVFNMIDKMIPGSSANGPDHKVHSAESENTVDAIEPVADKSLEKNKLEISENVSDNTDHGHCNKFISCGSSFSSSKDPKEILQNLSEIIKNECKDPKQNYYGQQLIANLVDLLNERQELIEPVNSTVKSTLSNDERPLNLSVRNLVRVNTQQGLSQSFTFSTSVPPNKLLTNLKAKKVSSTGSLDLERDKTGSEFGKLKPKKVDDKGFDKKKGPLKALIPVGSMSKNKDLTLSRQSLNSEVSTPPKLEQSQLNSIKYKRTSTPILSQIKPVAQSTPDSTKHLNNSIPSLLRKPNFCSPVLPSAKPNNARLSSLSKSKLTPLAKNGKHRESLSELQNSMLRRHSTTDLKNHSNGFSKLKRNNSIGKSFRLSSEISKVKENLSPLKSLMKKVQKNNIFQDKNSINKTGVSVKTVRF